MEIQRDTTCSQLTMSVHNSWHYDISMWMVSSTLRYKIYDLTVSPTSCCEIISRAAMEGQHLADSADF